MTQRSDAEILADWSLIARHLSDNPAVWEVLHESLVDEEGYFERNADELGEWDIDDPEEVSPWIALVLGLEKADALTIQDWKSDAYELHAALATMPLVIAAGADVSSVSDPEVNVLPGAHRADGILKQHGLTLVYLDLDSDSYAFAVAPTAVLTEIQDAATRLGYQLRLITQAEVDEAIEMGFDTYQE